MLKRLLVDIKDWLKAQVKEMENFPPYPFCRWDELPKEDWPENYNPLEDASFKHIDSAGKLK